MMHGDTFTARSIFVSWVSLNSIFLSQHDKLQDYLNESLLFKYTSDAIMHSCNGLSVSRIPIDRDILLLNLSHNINVT